jgi:hypothetical protein
MARARRELFDTPLKSADEFEEALAEKTRGRFSRRTTFAAGNWAALFDVIATAVDRYDVNGPETENPDDSIAIPLWAARALLDDVLPPFLSTVAAKETRRGVPVKSQEKRSGRPSRWAEQWRQDLVDWGRFKEVWYRHIARRDDDPPAPKPSAAERERQNYEAHQRARRSRFDVDVSTPYPWTDDQVFEAVSRVFKGTVHGGTAAAMKKSYLRVAAALRDGQACRYYPTQWLTFEGRIRSAEENSSY